MNYDVAPSAVDDAIGSEKQPAAFYTNEEKCHILNAHHALAIKCSVYIWRSSRFLIKLHSKRGNWIRQKFLSQYDQPFICRDPGLWLFIVSGTSQYSMSHYSYQHLTHDVGK